MSTVIAKCIQRNDKGAVSSFGKLLFGKLTRLEVMLETQNGRPEMAYTTRVLLFNLPFQRH